MLLGREKRWEEEEMDWIRCTHEEWWTVTTSLIDANRGPVISMVWCRKCGRFWEAR